ncbi:hypothetical protein QTO34_016756 [Cnephaeus nilssonii]|uniref:Uncharacterized protein n=1 Tax=Cnephaeus nilssonii TaxID=3371016 RepID=A0AA40I2U4_CNENI|nr:hypothetical protein QTO34_016756 [Eptesicus nilssonii]
MWLANRGLLTIGLTQPLTSLSKSHGQSFHNDILICSPTLEKSNKNTTQVFNFLKEQSPLPRPNFLNK